MVRHDARAVVLILDKAMGDTGGVNADYAHLDGIEDVRNHMNNYKERRCRNAHTKRGIAIGPEVGLGADFGLLLRGHHEPTWAHAFPVWTSSFSKSLSRHQ